MTLTPKEIVTCMEAALDMALKSDTSISRYTLGQKWNAALGVYFAAARRFLSDPCETTFTDYARAYREIARLEAP